MEVRMAERFGCGNVVVVRDVGAIVDVLMGGVRRLLLVISVDCRDEVRMYRL